VAGIRGGEKIVRRRFIDHTQTPEQPDKAARASVTRLLRARSRNCHANIQWQLADGDRVTTFKTSHGTHNGESSIHAYPRANRSQSPVRDSGMSCECATAQITEALGAWPSLFLYRRACRHGRRRKLAHRRDHMSLERGGRGDENQTYQPLEKSFRSIKPG